MKQLAFFCVTLTLICSNALSSYSFVDFCFDQVKEKVLWEFYDLNPYLDGYRSEIIKVDRFETFYTLRIKNFGSGLAQFKTKDQSQEVQIVVSISNSQCRIGSSSIITP